MPPRPGAAAHALEPLLIATPPVAVTSRDGRASACASKAQVRMTRRRAGWWPKAGEEFPFARRTARWSEELWETAGVPSSDAAIAVSWWRWGGHLARLAEREPQGGLRSSHLARRLVAQDHERYPLHIVRRGTTPCQQRTSISRQKAVGRRLPKGCGSNRRTAVRGNCPRSSGVDCRTSRFRQPHAMQSNIRAPRKWQTRDGRRL